MPHCIIEYTRPIENTVNITQLMEATFDSLDQSGLFNRTAIKARAIPLDYFKSGLDRDDYIHISVRILPGRTDDQKKALSSLILKNITPIANNTKSISVEIIDMHGNSYDKYLSS